MLAIAAAVLTPLLDTTIPDHYRGIDWRSYEAVALRAVHQQPIYVDAQLSGPYRLVDLVDVKTFIYPPPTALLFVPFLPFGPLAWAGFCSVVFATGLWAMIRRDFRDRALLVFSLVLLSAALTRPYIEAAVVGNNNLLVAGLFAWAWALGRAGRFVPVLAGIGAFAKIHPAVIAGWTQREHAIKSVALAIGVVAAIVVLTLPVVSLNNWLDFGRAVENVRPYCTTDLQPLVCKLPQGGQLIVLGISGALVLAAIASRNDAFSFFLLIMAVLIPQPEYHLHTFLYVEVMIVAMVGWAVTHAPPGRRSTGPRASEPRLPASPARTRGAV